MDNVHEMAAELFVQVMAQSVAKGGGSQQVAAEVARDCYVYARSFFDEHGRHIERGA